MNSLTAIQKDVLKSIAEKEQIKDFDLVINIGTEKGDNYLGLIKNVIISDRKSDKKLDLILKLAESDPNIRKKAPVKNFYKREIFIYGVVFEEFKKLQNGKLLKSPFTGYAKYYGSCEQELAEFLILNNLKTNGYKMLNRRVSMDMQHITAVLKEYGKFHSYSLALKYQRPFFYNALKKDLTNVFGSPSKERTEKLVPVIFGKTMEAFKDNKKISQALHAYITNGAVQFIYNVLKEADSYEYAVVQHGDCWTNNFLFKYEDIDNLTLPTKVAFIDFQMSRITHPTIDLAYFLFVNLPKNILYDYRHCLKIYYESLKEHLEQLGTSSDKIFSYSELIEEFRKHAKFGLQISILIIKILVSEADEAVDLVAELGSGKSLYEALTYKSVNETEYLKRIEDILNFLIDEQLL